ncbi:hypothetical protein [Isoptericola sp. NPDC058082]|uniref:hypothetical protein n=1 Tax=Isoptericola sp. NPDC058082 TaxID=3346331 RepID=UPI0036EE238A
MAVIQPRNHEELQQQLSRMHLAPWCFENALAAGAAEASSYSSGAPTMAAEFGRWSRTVEELHHGILGLQRGWERADPMNQPTWINPNLNTALVVSSGDVNTGEATFGDPSNRNPKGKTFGALVAANEEASLFDTVVSGEMVDITETWVFLYNQRQGYVFSELSLPIVMPGAYIENWRARLLLPRFDGGTRKFEAPVHDIPDQDFNFKIQRR